MTRLRITGSCCKEVTFSGLKSTEKMKLILSDIKNMRKNLLLKEEIDNFYNQILLLPLKFTTLRINTLGKKFILQFLGGVVTYVVILEQFNVE
ncbi:uncharacterized protein LOC127277887 isoform X2 [Leptopilina boulardi]|uniref:uncharacterized protein LOC127277887 isoform X2 n=1 Tax=Leptopilina boulardi TaxID=63433 RepID=UPI0021F613B2|nr:uncharacterized protein LOC127277887 isoform X2 [Leptopilina boulardi]